MNPLPRQCDETKACHAFRQKWVGKQVQYDTVTYDRGLHGAPTPIIGRTGVVIALQEVQRKMRTHTGCLVVEIADSNGHKWEDIILASQVKVVASPTENTLSNESA